MWHIEQSRTTSRNLDQVLSELTQNHMVDGILLMGSATKHPMNKFGDIDMAIVVNELPENVLSVNTYIENRFAEIFFYSNDEILALLAKDKVDPDKKDGWIVNWLRDGKIVTDKSGLLHRLRERLSTIYDEVTDALSYSSWRRINYNYVQNTRYFKSGEPQYLKALDVRLLYSIAEVFFGYFNVRKIPWRGEKEAIHWLEEHDHEFLSLFQDYLQEVNRDRKMDLYKQLAEKALEPTGGLWNSKITVISPSGEDLREALAKGLRFWNQLIKT